MSQPTTRLIIHLGDGKTGTSSIQHTLRDNAAHLRKQGIHYLGMLMEQSPVKRYPWQRLGAFQELNPDNPQALVEFEDALRSGLEQILSKGGHTALLSNESLFHLGQHLIPAFERIHDTTPWKVEYIVYIRGYAAWIRSAYNQWGLKHKTYEGPLQPFPEWARSAIYQYAPSLQAWAGNSDIPLHIKNFDQVQSLVPEFFKTLALPLSGIEEKRANESPSPEELALRAYFNSQFTQEVHPNKFDRLFRSAKLSYSQTFQQLLDSLLPSQADIQAHLEACRNDAATTNLLLQQRGEAPLSVDGSAPERTVVDNEKIVATLFSIISQQAIRINQMEARLDKLEASRQPESGPKSK